MPAVNKTQFAPPSTTCPGCGKDLAADNRSVYVLSNTGTTRHYGRLSPALYGWPSKLRLAIKLNNRRINYLWRGVHCTHCDHNFGPLTLTWR